LSRWTWQTNFVSANEFLAPRGLLFSRDLVFPRADLQSFAADLFMATVEAICRSDLFGGGGVGGDDARRRRDLEKRRDRGNLFVARRKVPPRGSTSRPRETRGYAVCQAKESLAFLPILLL
jgi:hypothetical protein